MGRGGLSLIAAISFPPLPRSPRGDHAISPRDAAFSLATRLSLPPLPPPPARPPARVYPPRRCLLLGERAGRKRAHAHGTSRFRDF